MTAVSETREAAWFRYLRLAVLMSGGPLAAMVQMAIIPAMAQMAQRFSEGGADGAFRAQLVMAVSAPTMAIGGPLSGWVAERVGKRPTFLVSALMFGLAGCGGAFAPDFWSLLATRVLLGLASVGIITVGMALIAESYSGAALDRLIGLVTFVGSSATLVILEGARRLTESIGWQGPFALYGIGFVVLVFGLPTIAEKRRATEAAEIAEDASIRSAVPLLVLTVVLAFMMYMVSVQGPEALAKKGFADPTTPSVILMVMTVGTMTTSFSFGFIRSRVGFPTILAGTFALLGLGTAGFAVTSNLVLLGVMSGIAGLGSGLIQPLTQSEILGKVPPAAASRALGLTIGCIFLAQLANPFVLKPVRAHFGIDNTFLYVGLLGLAGFVLTLAWRVRGSLRAAAPAE